MLKIYADECFPVEVSLRLRAIGYDIRTCQEEKQDRKGISDENVMQYAIQRQRAVITCNMSDFKHLHKKFTKEKKQHFGIIACTENLNVNDFVARINSALQGQTSLENTLICIYRA